MSSNALSGDASADGAGAHDGGGSVLTDGSTSADGGGIGSDAGGGGTSDAPSGSGCTIKGGVASGCANGEVCTSTDCMTGTCSKVTGGSNAFTPVCGCDSVNYWNASVAATFLTGVRSNGVCADPATCTGTAGQGVCSVNKASKLDCAFEHDDLAGSACGPAKAVACWGLPNNCPSVGGVTACGASGGCLALCDAIQKQTTFRATTCTLK